MKNDYFDLTESFFAGFRDSSKESFDLVICVAESQKGICTYEIRLAVMLMLNIYDCERFPFPLYKIRLPDASPMKRLLVGMILGASIDEEMKMHAAVVGLKNRLTAVAIKTGLLPDGGRL